ncbi:MAG TPA: GntR family transcriptional regulator [Candidatus Binataceae bacterium]|nr:GntR family transcriptional regulator [Candidatus Binataceae bacterium]
MAPGLLVTSHVPLPEQVYHKVRRAILNGFFAPGQMLRQEEVAARLGVSRSPLREALPRLEAEGMVVLHPRRGYAVTSLDPAEIGELFDLRILLEAELARHAVERRQAHDVARVRAILAEMSDPKLLITGESRQGWFALNNRFHDALLEPGGHRHHLRALENASALIEPYIRMETNLTGDLRQAQQEHSGIADAFAVGDPVRFKCLIREHAENTRTRLLIALPGACSVPR